MGEWNFQSENLRYFGWSGGKQEGGKICCIYVVSSKDLTKPMTGPKEYWT